MVSILKKKARKVFLGKMASQLARVGEDKAMMACSASLRTLGGITRPALMDCMLVIWKWNKLRNPPDPLVLQMLNKVIEPLEDVDNANMVFNPAGEGGALVYLEALDEAADKVENRFTREIRDIVFKARDKYGNEKVSSM